MIFEKHTCNNTDITYSRFDGKESSEYNLMISPNRKNENFLSQLKSVQHTLELFLISLDLSPEALVFQRFYLSDFSNQCEILSDPTLSSGSSAVSVVQQPPMNGAKVMLWATLIDGSDFCKVKSENRLTLSHNGYAHVYATQMTSQNHEMLSYHQTSSLLSDYLQLLDSHNLRLKDHCIRTWLYVRDIDNNYEGMVKARNHIFDRYGLTQETHFIASTGIEGRFANPSVSVMMDAYAVGGIVPEQIRFLNAPNHLNPTYEYGVAFERGTAIEYGDRRHIFISGTASIDCAGNIVHVGDIHGQVKRIFENIIALLSDAGATMDDLTGMTVYLRDWTDYSSVRDDITLLYPHIPCVILLAPVCRPGWLVEIECIAIKQINNTKYKSF